MLEQFKSFISKHRTFREIDKLLLALSGGLDSVCLLYLLTDLNIRPALAHCNFQLRGADADADEQFVRDLAEKFNLEIYVKRFNTTDYAQANAISIQMAARTMRFDWFEELNATHGFQKILLAHHRDDQVETFFINLLRGSGLSGLKGMRPVSGIYARPLLFAGRDQIYEYAIANKLEWREDRTNIETKYLRNHIRHKLLPTLTQIDEHFLDKISESTAILAEEESLLHSLEDQLLDKIISRTNLSVRIEKAELDNYPEPQLVLYRFLKEYNFNITQTQDIAVCSQLGSRFYSSTHELLVERNFLEILPKINPENEQLESSITAQQSRLELPIKLEIQKLAVDEDFVLEKNPDLALLDFDRLKFPLKIRKWQEGDRFKPLGMKGSKLLSDYFVDNKFSELEKRNSFLLLNADNQILWLIGHRIADSFKITSETKTAYRIDKQ